jgi:predicted transglutaminase-like cysteine proteinase
MEPTPGADGSSNRAGATVFSINAVLAKLDRQGGGRASPDGRLAALTPSNTATDAPAPAEGLPATGNEPFGLFTFRAPDGQLWRKWRGVESAMAQEKAVLQQCRADAQACPAHAAQFLRLVGAVKAKTGRARLEEANRGINQAIRYVNDLSQHGELDRWSTPLASFATAKGDCEDYAIAKYVALIEAGVARDDLQLVLVRDRLVRQDHAVLAARHDGRWLILDNRWSELTADGEATRFTPLFAINHDGVHLFAAPYARNTGDQRRAAPAASPAVASTGSEPAASAASGIGTLPVLL